MANRFLAASLVVLASLAACGGGGGGGNETLPSTLCTPGVKGCLGNYAATCGQDGREWFGLRECFPDGQCVDGACQPRACTPAGKDRCEGKDVAVQCSADGLFRTLQPCPNFQSCYGGRCLLDECDPVKDTAICVFDTRVTCESGKRVATPCPNGYACEGTECVLQQDCQAEEARCSGEAASGVCRLNRTGWDATVCGPRERCSQGFCQPRLADPVLPDVPDVPSDDVPDVPEDTGYDPGRDFGPLPDVPLSSSRARLNGALVEFDRLSEVVILPATGDRENTVQVSLYSSNVKDLPLPVFPDEGASVQVEINLVGLAIDPLEGIVGTYTCGGDQGPRAQVFLRYGLHGAVADGPCRQGDFTASACTVEVLSVGPAGTGPFIGTVSADPLVECTTPARSVALTDGTFEATP